MSRLLVSSMARLITLTFLAVLASAAPVRADLVTWTLTGVTLADGGSVSGWFVVDTNFAPQLAAWNVTVDLAARPSYVSATLPNPFTFSSASAICSGHDYAGPQGTLQFEWISAPGLTVVTYPSFDLFFIVPAGVSSLRSGSLPVGGVPGYEQANAYEWWAKGQPGDPGYLPVYGVDGGSVNILAGEIVGSSVPLPSTASLLGSALILLAWPRRRKQLGK